MFFFLWVDRSHLGSLHPSTRFKHHPRHPSSTPFQVFLRLLPWSTSSPLPPSLLPPSLKLKTYFPFFVRSLVRFVSFPDSRQHRILPPRSRTFFFPNDDHPPFHPRRSHRSRPGGTEVALLGFEKDHGDREDVGGESRDGCGTFLVPGKFFASFPVEFSLSFLILILISHSLLLFFSFR